MVEELQFLLFAVSEGNGSYFPFLGPSLIMNAYVLHCLCCEIESSSLCSVNNNACTDA